MYAATRLARYLPLPKPNQTWDSSHVGRRSVTLLPPTYVKCTYALTNHIDAELVTQVG